MMNPVAILLVTLLIAMEKMMPRPQAIIRLAGFAAVILGIVMIGKIALHA